MSVLSRARELLGGAHFSVENLLTDLENEREEAARRSQQARQSQNEIEVMQQKLREELRTLEELRAEERAKGAEEAHRVVRNAEKEARQMLREARDAIAELKDEMMRQHEAALAAAGAAAGAVPEQPADDGNAAARLDELEASTRERLREQANELREQAASERDDIERARAEKEAVAARPWPEEKDLGPLKNGDDVYIQHLQQEGTVVEIGHGDKVQVKIGPMRMKLERAQVRKIPPKKRADERGDGWEYSGKPTTRVSRVADVSLRLDLRGKRAEEAGYLLTEYLDQVAPMHVGPVTIVHGKGTGVLLNVVKETLKAHPSVESFRLGEAGEGDWGVTVVTLK
jgi:DNA mismatch repair protein MutS2